jgi:hypothetical protein
MASQVSGEMPCPRGPSNASPLNFNITRLYFGVGPEVFDMLTVLHGAASLGKSGDNFGYGWERHPDANGAPHLNPLPLRREELAKDYASPLEGEAGPAVVCGDG